MSKKNQDIFNMTGVTKVIILCIINILFQKVNFVVWGKAFVTKLYEF